MLIQTIFPMHISGVLTLSPNRKVCISYIVIHAYSYFRNLVLQGHVIAGKLTCTCFTDWGPKVDVVGFCFLDLASNYEPPEPLLRWLGSGDKPIYIGFGSLVSYCPPLTVMYFAAFTFCQSINGNCAFKKFFISI